MVVETQMNAYTKKRCLMPSFCSFPKIICFRKDDNNLSSGLNVIRRVDAGAVRLAFQVGFHVSIINEDTESGFFNNSNYRSRNIKWGGVLMKVSGIVLAGGRSSRMGQDKTLMTVNEETLITKTVKELRKVADEIIIASNQTAKYMLPETVEVPDIYPGMGPLGGIHAGLLAAHNHYAFVVAADMPRFSADLAHFLIEKCSGYDVAAPEIDGRLETLCAVYSRDCLQPIEQLLLADLKKVDKFFPQVRLLKVQKEELAAIIEDDVFYNLNTPEDYRALLKKEKYTDLR